MILFWSSARMPENALQSSGKLLLKWSLRNGSQFTRQFWPQLKAADNAPINWWLMPGRMHINVAMISHAVLSVTNINSTWREWSPNWSNLVTKLTFIGMILRVSVLRFTTSVQAMSQKNALNLTSVGMGLIETKTILHVHAQNGLGIFTNVVNTTALKIIGLIRRLANVKSILTPNAILKLFWM